MMEVVLVVVEGGWLVIVFSFGFWFGGGVVFLDVGWGYVLLI